jgi:hypothetical protein
VHATVQADGREVLLELRSESRTVKVDLSDVRAAISLARPGEKPRVVVAMSNAGEPQIEVTRADGETLGVALVEAEALAAQLTEGATAGEEAAHEDLVVIENVVVDDGVGEGSQGDAPAP